MASPGLALSRFPNLDQEFASEYPSPFTGSTHQNNAVSTEIQPLPLTIPHDVVTLSSAGSQRESYQVFGASAGASLTAGTADPSVRAEEATPALSTARSSESSQASTRTGADSTASSEVASTKPAAPPKESETSQDQLYQATTQTTQQSLLQLDRTLQQIGVNPQHTSLIRRVALVRLANDPPALGEYFGVPSSAPPPVPKPAAQSNSPASGPSASKPIPDTPMAAKDTTRRPFVPPGNLLNVSA